MAKANALARRPVALEHLEPVTATTSISSDKTGTLKLLLLISTILIYAVTHLQSWFIEKKYEDVAFGETPARKKFNF